MHPRRHRLAQRGLGTPVLIGREDRVRATLQRHGPRQARGGRDPQCAPVRLQPRATPSTSTAASSARASCSGTASGWSTRAATSSPPAWWRTAMPTRWSPASPGTIAARWRISAASSIRAGRPVFGLTVMVAKGRTVFIADTTVHELPDTEDAGRHRDPDRARGARAWASAARGAARPTRTFGDPPGPARHRCATRSKLLDRRRVDFEYDGEMAADVALDPELMALYPFCRLTGPANILIMPALHAAHLHQAAAAARRRHGDRPAAGRPVQAGADRADERPRLRPPDNVAAIAAHDAVAESPSIGPPPSSVVPPQRHPHRGWHPQPRWVRPLAAHENKS